MPKRISKHTVAKATIKSLQNQLARALAIESALREEISEAKNVLGKSHVAFAPLNVQLHHQTSRQVIGYGFDRTIPLDVLAMRAKRQDGAIHFVANFADGATGYAISDESAKYMPDDVMAQRVMRIMMPEIVRMIKKAKA